MIKVMYNALKCYVYINAIILFKIMIYLFMIYDEVTRGIW